MLHFHENDGIYNYLARLFIVYLTERLGKLFCMRALAQSAGSGVVKYANEEARVIKLSLADSCTRNIS